MTIAPSARRKISGKKHAELLPARELRGIIETVLRLAKSTVASETEVHIDEVADSLTRFANNGIHQNVFEHCATVSVRTVTQTGEYALAVDQLFSDAETEVFTKVVSLAES